MRYWTLQIKNEDGTKTNAERYDLKSFMRLSQRLGMTEREIWRVLFLNPAESYDCTVLEATAHGANKYAPTHYAQQKAVITEPQFSPHTKEYKNHGRL